MKTKMKNRERRKEERGTREMLTEEETIRKKEGGCQTRRRVFGGKGGKSESFSSLEARERGILREINKKN